jgi:predicted RNase H-like HicB family nuclease
MPISLNPPGMTVTLDLPAVRHLTVQDPETGNWIASNDSLRVSASGSTKAEAEAHFSEALVALVNYCLQQGLVLPPALRKSRVRTVA